MAQPHLSHLSVGRAVVERTWPISSPYNISLVRLSEANKARLFNKATAFVEAGTPTAQGVLTRLEKWNPDVAAQFALKRTAVSEAPLRMLVGEDAGIARGGKEEVDGYIAVSYCWRSGTWKPARSGKKSMGSEEEEKRHTERDREMRQEEDDNLVPPWPFAEPMARKLLELRSSPGDGIWLDQRCIDQANDAEKRLAIGAMDVVYRQARIVAVVLEDVVLSQREAVAAREAMRRCGDKVLAPWKMAAEEIMALATAVNRVLASRWATRAWCHHEFRLAVDENVKFNFFCRFLVFADDEDNDKRDVLVLLWPAVMGSLLTCQSNILSQPLAPTFDVRKQTANFGRFMNALEDYSGQNPLPPSHVPKAGSDNKSWLRAFISALGFNCSVTKDMISIALNTNGICLYYTGNAQSIDECAYVFSILCLCAGEVSILGIHDGLLLRGNPEPGDDKRVSWLRRKTYVGGEQKSPFATLNHLDSIYSARFGELETDLLFLTSRLETPPIGKLQKAFEILENDFEKNLDILKDMQELLNGQNPGSLAKMMDIQSYKEYVACVIAACLENGATWIERVWFAFQEAARMSEGARSYICDSNPELMKTACAILRHEGISAWQEDQKQTEAVIAFLSTMTNIRFRSMFISKRWVRCVKTSAFPDQKALVLAAAPQTLNYILAIPTSLAEPTYSFNIGRAWLLEEVTGSAPEAEPSSKDEFVKMCDNRRQLEQIDG
ncbi:hypothetical protein BDY21DRAFT_365878 [Lineolata rhizophorae]|uniref:Heterokaryon incompatibility domain-containing protein n=1 Tax=Lineolata rhizophorae TaxID=578093 RepID=A0A6A6NTM3_9PEZI|nr:hypothetical protein BDY21DRAFT_365878 [Lineolata rhizophorae]